MAGCGERCDGACCWGWDWGSGSGSATSASWNWLPLVVVQDGLGAQLGLAARLAVARVAEAVGWPEPHAQGRVGLAAALLVVAEPVQGVAGWAAQHFVAQLVAVQVQQVSVRQRTRHEQCPAHAECAAHP